MALNAAGIELVNFYIQWPKEATLSLIQYRRLYQTNFSMTPIHDQKQLWSQIFQGINDGHPDFTQSKQQCQNKWNSLKSEYKNLKRLLDGNPFRFPTHTPTIHDEYFHEELSDEFWLTECNCLLFN